MYVYMHEFQLYALTEEPPLMLNKVMHNTSTDCYIHEYAALSIQYTYRHALLTKRPKTIGNILGGSVTHQVKWLTAHINRSPAIPTSPQSVLEH